LVGTAAFTVFLWVHNIYLRESVKTVCFNRSRLRPGYDCFRPRRSFGKANANDGFVPLPAVSQFLIETSD
jgi:hypothetical protein